MSDPRRPPQVFDPNDPRLSASEPGAPGADDPPASLDPALTRDVPAIRIPTTADLQSGMRWGMILVSTALSLFIMSLVLRFWTFVWDLFGRQDWIGWLAVVLAGLLVVSFTMLLLRELLGVVRLAKLQRLRKNSTELLSNNTMLSPKELKFRLASVYAQLLELYSARPDLAWARARLGDHNSTIMSGTERLALLDRELMAVLDDQAKLAITQSARRVSVVTAITPFAIFDMGFVLYENLRMLRRIATAYGGRPGSAGLFRLGARVVGHVVATGGLALTDDLFGQFIGQGLAKRLSARAGQGMFNGGLTARLGVAAIDVCRPLPFIEAKPPRFRDLAMDVARGLTVGRRDDAAKD